MKNFLITVFSGVTFVAIFAAVYFFVIPGGSSSTITASQPSVSMPTTTTPSKSTSTKPVSAETNTVTQAVSSGASGTTSTPQVVAPTVSRTTRTS